jgi:hypothetical protein
VTIFEVGERVVLGSKSKWAPELQVGWVGTVEAVYDLGDEFGDTFWDNDEPGYDVKFDNFHVVQCVEEENLYDDKRGIYKVDRRVDTVIVEMDATITVTVKQREGFTLSEAVAEVLFNFGIGDPADDGEEWLNMEGQAYLINSFEVSTGQRNRG